MNDQHRDVRYRIAGMIHRMTAQNHRCMWLHKLDREELREVEAIIRALDYEKMSAVQRARRMPWRRE